MITAKDIRNRRFEKAAFGYKQEEIDEFLSFLEEEFKELEHERHDTNNKIQILADKVREYMRDEDALKDALIGAQKQGHKVIADAKVKAEAILSEANEKATSLIEEAKREYEIVSSSNRTAIERERESLIVVQKQVADFKRSLFDMYKSHLELISSMPETFEDEISVSMEAEEIAETVAANAVNSGEPYTTSQFSQRNIKNAYEKRFGDST